jgi:CTP synthase (UTP-ammonia lyase)
VVERVIAVVGDRDERYETHRGIDRVLASLPLGLTGGWHATDELAPTEIAAAAGIWMAPGTPYRDRAAALRVIRHARENDQPTLGSCGGFQHMLLEFARSVAGIEDAEHEEEQPDAQTLLLTRLSCSLIGQIRPVTTVAGTMAAAVCGPGPFDGFHYCNFGLAPIFERTLVAAGLVVSGRAPDAGVEIVELPGHLFYFGTMFQPQMSPQPDGEHPLLQAFFAAARAAG